MRKRFFWLLLPLLFLGPIWLSAQDLPWPAQSPITDSYGYRWETNAAPGGPFFEWIDIRGVGEQVSGLEDETITGPFPIGMDFPFYWNSYDQVWIGANGYISFTSGIPISVAGNGFPLLPNFLPPNAVIAPYLADFTGEGNNNPGEVWRYYDSVSERFILSWIDWPYFSSESPGYQGANSFQLILDKADSSIYINYLSLSGSWDPAYDQVAYPFVVGMENQAGNMGFMPHGLPIDSTQRAVDSSSIRFIRPQNPRIPIVDLEISWVQNLDNAAVFLPWSPPLSSTWRPAYQFKAQLINSGLEVIQGPFQVRSWAKNPAGSSVFSRTKTFAELVPGSERFLLYDDHFDPPSPGTYTGQAFLVASSRYQDINLTNDTASVELIFLDTTESEHVLSYEQTTEQTPLFLFEGTNAAVLFEPYGYPISIQALDFHLFLSTGATPNTGFLARVYANDSAAMLGTLLSEQQILLSEVVLPSGWTRVNLDTPIRIDSGGFFVSWTQIDPGLKLLSDRTPPFSNRNFNRVAGEWRPSLTNYKEDLMIRALVDHSQAIPTVGIDSPNHILDWEIFPSPATESLHIHLSLLQATPIRLRMISIHGHAIRDLQFPAQSSFQYSLNVATLPAGVYVVELMIEQKYVYTKILIK